MNQPFCSPVKALRSVLDAAALLPSPSPETIPLEAACGFGVRRASPPVTASSCRYCRETGYRPDTLPRPLIFRYNTQRS